MTADAARAFANRGLVAAAVALVLLATTMIFPEIDLTVASWYYVPAKGFPLARLPIFSFIMVALPDLVIGATTLAAVIGIAATIRREEIWGITGKKALFLAISLAAGPGLVVNTLLKDHWGRARPHQIVEFGGSAQFSPAVLWSDQCARNCSFPSGHAALGFWLIAFAMILPAPWRGIATGVALMIGTLVGLMRIAQGAHFLSDTLAAGLIVFGINYLTKLLILDRQTPVA